MRRSSGSRGTPAEGTRTMPGSAAAACVGYCGTTSVVWTPAAARSSRNERIEVDTPFTRGK
jgi:hypothetical protein